MTTGESVLVHPCHDRVAVNDVWLKRWRLLGQRHDAELWPALAAQYAAAAVGTDWNVESDYGVGSCVIHMH